MISADEYVTWAQKVDAGRERHKKAAHLLLDAAGRQLKIGQTVAYAISLGHSPSMQIATIVEFTDKKKIKLKISEAHRQTWGEKEVVSVQFPDRMVILEPLSE